jgi:hypothetical protein
MATWKKVVVSGSNISQLNNDAGYLTAGTLGAKNAYSTASFNGTNLIAGSTTASLSFASSSGQGLNITANAVTNTLTFGLSSIPNSSLANSSITIAGNATSLGGSVTQAQILAGSTVVSASVLSSPAQGQALLTTNGVAGSTIDLGLETGDSPTFVGLTLTGNLVVLGTASFQNTSNLLVADRFILFASGSNTAGDGGIVVQQGTQNIGELYGYDSNTTRWGFTSSFDATGNSFTPAVYAGAVETSAVAPSAAPLYGGASNGSGTLHVDTNTGDIYIYS